MAGVSVSTPPAVDTTAPAAPSAFAAVLDGPDVALTWVNPVDPDLDHLVVRRKQGSPPTSITDGTAVFTSTAGTNDMRAPLTCAQYSGNQQLRWPRDRSLIRFVADKSGTLSKMIVPGKLHASETGYASSPFGGEDTGVVEAILYAMDTDGGANIAAGALASVNFTVDSQEPSTSPFRNVLELNFNVALTINTAYVVLLRNADTRNIDAGTATTLNGALDATQTNVTLAAGRPEHVNGGCLSINGGAELCIIDSGGGTTALVVQRGRYGTTGVIHSSGESVQGASPFYFSLNSLYYAIPFGSGVVGSQGALARNHTAAGAADLYYSLDGRANYGGTHDSGTTWYIPSNAGYGSVNRHFVPTYTCVWSDGSVTGQPYYSSHALPAGTYRCYYQNIEADWTITQIGGFFPSDVELDTNASTPVLVYVNDVLVDTVLLGGRQGFLRNWLTAPLTLHAGDVLKLETAADPTGVAGLRLQSQYCGQFIDALAGTGNNATYPFYADATDLATNDPGNGGAERMLTLYPMPARSTTVVQHEEATTDPGAAGWAYSVFAVDTQGNASVPATLVTTSTMVGGNLAASPGWATPGWFTLGGVGAITTGAASLPIIFGASTTGAVVNPIEEGDFYATVTELARILKIREPSEEQEAAMLRVLETSSLEIDSELDREDGPYTAPFPSLVVQVCLERATEHWRQQESPFGLIAIGVDVPAERSSSNSWERHALKLAPLKEQWGLA